MEDERQESFLLELSKIGQMIEEGKIEIAPSNATPEDTVKEIKIEDVVKFLANNVEKR